MKHFTIDIDVDFDGEYVPGKRGRMAIVQDENGNWGPRWIGRVPARIDGFKIVKWNGKEWIDISHIFDPKELKQRELEYLSYKEEEREQEGFSTDDAS